MQKKKVTLKHRLEYMFFAAFILMVKISPLIMARFNKKILYFLGRAISKKRFQVVQKNLKTAFPHLPQEEILLLRDKVYHHFSSVFIEIIYLFASSKKIDKLLKKIEINNLDILKNALEKKKGVIIFSAHFGNWELVPYILSRELNVKLVSIAREMDNPLIERVVKKFRHQMGSIIIYKQNSIRTILKMLEENNIIYLLIDQNTIEREAVFVEFFGKTVSAVPSVSQLHIRKDKPVVPLFLHYEEDKIVLDIQPELEFPLTGDQQEDIRQLTQHCTTMIETNIRKHPSQWFWFHNRWKTKQTKEE